MDFKSGQREYMQNFNIIMIMITNAAITTKIFSIKSEEDGIVMKDI
jgi:hypothetical protein